MVSCYLQEETVGLIKMYAYNFIQRASTRQISMTSLLHYNVLRSYMRQEVSEAANARASAGAYVWVCYASRLTRCVGAQILLLERNGEKLNEM